MRAVWTTPNTNAIGRIFLQDIPLRVTLEQVETAKQSAQRDTARSSDSNIDNNIVKQALHSGHSGYRKDNQGLNV